MQKEKLLIIGFGGNAVDFFDTISMNYDLVGFVDDDVSKHGIVYNGISVSGRHMMDKYPDARIITLIGSEKTFKMRAQIIADFLIPANRFATAIHPRATVSSDAKIGYDVVIMPGVVIPSNARVGNHIFILANTVIHHDCFIGDYTLIGSNVTIAGHVEVGSSCFIGSGTSVRNQIKIGDYSIAGMGSNVLSSIPNSSRVAGNPARPL